MNFDYPVSSQISELRSLWKEAFGDEDVFLDAFFETAFSPRRCRCIEENGKVLAALYWFEVTCNDRRFAYLYAIATAKSHRGRGLFTALLQDVKCILTEEGFDGILLVPETEALGRMYEKLGFSVCTHIREFTATAGEKNILLRETGAAEFARLREALLPSGSVLQTGADLNFLATQCRFWAGEGWIAAGYIHESKLNCAEFLGNETSIPDLLRTLEVPKGNFRMPGEEMPFAYLLPLCKGCGRPAYFGLALD